MCILYECVRERERERCYNINLHILCGVLRERCYNISDVCGNVITESDGECALRFIIGTGSITSKVLVFCTLWITRARCSPKNTPY